MSFPFLLGDFVPPATTNALFPEQANVSFPGDADLSQSVVFPQLLAALSGADVGPSSSDSAAGMLPVAPETTPFLALPRSAVMSSRHVRVGRQAIGNDEQNDPAICSMQYILPWTSNCQEVKSKFGSSLSQSFPPAEPEPGEAALSKDANLPDSQFVTLPVGFFPAEPLLQTLPVSADALVETWSIGEEPIECEELPCEAATSTLPAAALKDTIPVWEGAERNVYRELLPTVLHQEGNVLIPPLMGVAENGTDGKAARRESVASSLQGAPLLGDARRQVLDGRPPDPAMSKLSLREAGEPVTREAFRLLLRENSAPAMDSPAAATPASTPDAARQVILPESSDQAPEGPVRPPQTSAPQEGPAEATPARPRTPIRAERSIPDAPPLSKTSAPVFKPVVPGTAEATQRGIAVSAGFSDGGSAHNGETKHGEQASALGEKPEASGKPVLSREHLPLLVNARPTAEPFNGKPVSELAPPATFVDEPVGVPAGPNPVRQLRVSLQSSEAGVGVQLLVQQRPGGVEVSVHSPNQSVRETLRSGLSELIGALDRKGVVTEALPSISGVSEGLGERVHSTGPATATEGPEGDGREDPRSRQDRQPQWESGGDNRRRQNPDADAWKKYLEEYAWRNQ